MRELNLKAIVFQWIGIIFFINGLQRMYLLSQNEKYSCLIESLKNPQNDCWETLSPNENIGDFISNSLLGFFYAFIFGIIILSLLNWRQKIHWTNSFLVFILTFILFPLSFFREGFANDFFNSFWGEFTDKVAYENCLRGLIFTTFGIALFAVSIIKKPWTAYKSQ